MSTPGSWLDEDGVESLEHHVIAPRTLFSVNVGELWAYRELLLFLVWRTLKARYRQTVLGAGWAVIQPVTTMIVFTLVFGTFAKMPSEGIPYPVFSFAGLLPWIYFVSCLNASAGSVAGNVNLVTKVYVPRLIVPISTVVAPVVDFLLSFAVLLVLMFGYGIAPTWRVVATPLLLLLAMSIALGAGLWLAPLNVKYRDVLYAVPFLTQLWMWASPIVYPASIVPDRWRWLLAANPMASVIEGFRWALLGQPGPSPAALASGIAIGSLLLAGGLLFFRRNERYFADVI